MQPPATPAPVQHQIVGLTAKAFTVVDAASGQAVLSHRASERLPMASLTKLMTALLVLQRTDLDDIAAVSESVNRLGRGSSRMGISPGERLSVRDLLYGLMLPSGNDAAIALAEHVSGSEAAFVELMNRHARVLGLRDTHFANPHGLDGRGGGHYSTASDLAQLARAADANADLRTIMAARSWTARGAQHVYPMTNGNLLLGNYPGADGMKIGYTRGAGQTIIGSAERSGRRLLVVVLGSTQRVADASILLDRAFGQELPSPVAKE